MSLMQLVNICYVSKNFVIFFIKLPLVQDLLEGSLLALCLNQILLSLLSLDSTSVFSVNDLWWDIWNDSLKERLEDKENMLNGYEEQNAIWNSEEFWILIYQPLHKCALFLILSCILRWGCPSKIDDCYVEGNSDEGHQFHHS